MHAIHHHTLDEIVLPNKLKKYIDDVECYTFVELKELISGDRRFDEFLNLGTTKHMAFIKSHWRERVGKIWNRHDVPVESAKMLLEKNIRSHINPIELSEQNVIQL